MHVVNFVYLDQIFKKHEDQIAEQAGLSTKIRVLELGEYLGDQSFKVLVMDKNIFSGQRSHVV